MNEKCSQCGEQLALGKGCLTGIEADSEPYNQGEFKAVDLPENIDYGVGLNVCPECGYIEDVWPDN